MKLKSCAYLVLLLAVVIAGCNGNGPKIRKEMKNDALNVYNDIEVMIRHGELNENYNGVELFSQKYKSIKETDEESQLSILINDIALSFLDYEQGLVLNDYDAQKKATTKFTELSAQLKSLLGP